MHDTSSFFFLKNAINKTQTKPIFTSNPTIIIDWKFPIKSGLDNLWYMYETNIYKMNMNNEHSILLKRFIILSQSVTAIFLNSLIWNSFASAFS